MGHCIGMHLSFHFIFPLTPPPGFRCGHSARSVAHHGRIWFLHQTHRSRCAAMAHVVCLVLRAKLLVRFTPPLSSWNLLLIMSQVNQVQAPSATQHSHNLQPDTICQRQATLYEVLMTNHSGQSSTTPHTTQSLQEREETIRAIANINSGKGDGVAVHIKVRQISLNFFSVSLTSGHSIVSAVHTSVLQRAMGQTRSHFHQLQLYGVRCFLDSILSPCDRLISSSAGRRSGLRSVLFQ